MKLSNVSYNFVPNWAGVEESLTHSFFNTLYLFFEAIHLFLNTFYLVFDAIYLFLDALKPEVHLLNSREDRVAITF